MSAFTCSIIASFFIMVSVSSKAISNINYNAECMRRGCTVDDLKEEIDAMEGTKYEVLSWNVEGEKAEDICEIINKLDLLVINLQRVSWKQLNQLMEACLRSYNVSGIPTEASTSGYFNPIFYRDDNTQLMKIDDGTSGQWNEECKSLSWLRLPLHVSKPAFTHRRRLNKRSLSANLLAIMSGKTMLRKVRNRVSQTHYKKKVVFANVYFGESKSEESDVRNCLRYIYSDINDRRRYRTIFSANIGSKEKIVLNYPRRRSLFKYCAPSQSRQGQTENKICISNRGRRDTFQYRITASLQTNLKHAPTITAFTI